MAYSPGKVHRSLSLFQTQVYGPDHANIVAELGGENFELFFERLADDDRFGVEEKDSRGEGAGEFLGDAIADEEGYFISLFGGLGEGLGRAADEIRRVRAKH